MEFPEINAFEPSEARGRAVGTRIQKRLADSLRYIFEELKNAGAGVADGAFDGVLLRLSHGPVSPQLFGAYCDLVLALEAGAMDQAHALLAEIAAAPNVAGGPAVAALRDPAADTASNRYCRLTDTDVEMQAVIRPPKPDETERVRPLVGEALALLDAGYPAMAGEIRQIVRELVLATGPDDPKAPRFDGVSCFMLWGAVILNVTAYKTALDMVQALAHESGHNLLFGLCAYGPLQENDDKERYASPLRADLRPMDGIVHATYVTARMHLAVQRLIESGVLNREQLDEARKANSDNAKWFASGMETVDRHAKLTPLGKDVMENARRYMAAYLPAKALAS